MNEHDCHDLISTLRFSNLTLFGPNGFCLISLKQANIWSIKLRFVYFGTKGYQYRKYEQNQILSCVRDFSIIFGSY